ncbi:MAG: hypothetical protein IJ343_08905 [Clostridia bacterium]|nr:hypothetical protein [Clostridia bacterium]
MALRKMLGSADHPTVILLMRRIETQSKTTLTRFAAEYAAAQYLPILTERCPEETRPASAVEAVRAFLDGAKLTAVKTAVRDARTAAQALGHDPVCQAAARAVATACAVATTPTNALGFAFYGAAAFAYHRAGLAASPDTYDALADEELHRILTLLEAAAVPDEPDPVKVDWGC